MIENVHKERINRSDIQNHMKLIESLKKNHWSDLQKKHFEDRTFEEKYMKKV